MGKFEFRENQGILFKNDRKREGTTDADYHGSCLADGTEYAINAWIKTGKSGQKFMSLSFRRKESQSGTAAPHR